MSVFRGRHQLLFTKTLPIFLQNLYILLYRIFEFMDYIQKVVNDIPDKFWLIKNAQ